MVFTADPNFRSSHIQENDRHCVPSQMRCCLALAETNKVVHPQDVQTTAVVIAGSPYSMFPLYLLFLSTDSTDTMYHTLGLHGQRRSQSYMRCMAGKQL
jgi:hypothetical protein